jgi:hypothetical protein
MTEPKTLHDLMRSWDQLDDDALNIVMEDLRTLMAAGADPNEEDAHDMTPLAVLADAQQGYGNADKLAAFMVAHGANPLIKDRAFGKASGSVLDGLMKALIEAENAGRILRGEDGSNAMHILAEDNPASLCALLWRNTLDFPSHWFHETREDRATPLLALMSEHSVMNDFVTEQLGGMLEDSEIAWRAVALLLDRGSDLRAKDEKGVTAANKIWNIREELGEIEQYQATMDLVASHVALFGLDDNTDSAVGPVRVVRM